MRLSAARALAAVIVLCVTASCMRPSTSNAEAVLRDTAANMSKIESGDLSIRFETSLRERDPSGFQLEGPFSLRSPGSYPVAELEHTRFDGDDEQKGTFTSTGRQVYVTRGDRTRLVPSSTLAGSGLSDLVRSEDDAGESESLGKLDIGAWITGEPTVEGGGLVESVDTDKVSAELDVAEVMNGLIEIARALGGGASANLTPIEGAEQDRVQRAVRSATLDVWSGKDDKILRKLIIAVDLAVKDRELAEKLEELSGATIRLEATIGDLNEPVEIDAPESG